MKKNTINKKFGKLVVILLLVVLMTMSAAQAVVKIDMKNSEKITIPPLPMNPREDNYFTWEDLFNDATKIDPTMSDNYELLVGLLR